VRFLPNAVTLLRLLLVPVFGWSVVAGRTALAPALLVALAASDWVDGLLARRYRAESRLGALLDPLADKLAQLAGLILLGYFPHPAFTRIPVPFVSLVLGRELMLVYGALRVRFRKGTIHVRPRFEGKATTAILFALLVASSLRAPPWAVAALSVLGAPLVVVSAVRYILDGRRQMVTGGDR
jgi:CDP-diacylglycerol--glycerol-3-phosphate 3-phosphatidyltransferase